VKERQKEDLRKKISKQKEKARGGGKATQHWTHEPTKEFGNGDQEH